MDVQTEAAYDGNAMAGLLSEVFAVEVQLVMLTVWLPDAIEAMMPYVLLRRTELVSVPDALLPK